MEEREKEKQLKGVEKKRKQEAKNTNIKEWEKNRRKKKERWQGKRGGRN